MDEKHVLPAHADAFLSDAALGEGHEKTASSYRAGLGAVQRYAEDAGLAAEGRALDPASLRKDFLAEFYTWLGGKHKGHAAGAPSSKSGKKPREIRYSPATIRLYLVVAGLYLEWLASGGRLPAGLHVAEMREVLKARRKSAKRLHVKPRG